MDRRYRIVAACAALVLTALAAPLAGQREKAFGNWYLRVNADPFDDTKVVSISTGIQNPQSGRFGRTPVISVVCIGRANGRVGISTSARLAIGDTARVRYRIGSDRAVTVEAAWNGDLIEPHNYGKLVGDMRRAEKAGHTTIAIELAAIDSSGRTVDAFRGTVRLSGLDAALRAASTEGCTGNWNRY